jgi:hypothetical protein
MYTSEIIRGLDHQPLFEVMADDTERVFTGRSPSAPWAEIARVIADNSGQPVKGVSGPKKFGLTEPAVRLAIAEYGTPRTCTRVPHGFAHADDSRCLCRLPNAHLCTKFAMLEELREAARADLKGGGGAGGGGGGGGGAGRPAKSLKTDSAADAPTAKKVTPPKPQPAAAASASAAAKPPAKKSPAKPPKSPAKPKQSPVKPFGEANPRHRQTTLSFTAAVSTPALEAKLAADAKRSSAAAAAAGPSRAMAAAAAAAAPKRSPSIPTIAPAIAGPRLAFPAPPPYSNGVGGGGGGGNGVAAAPEPGPRKKPRLD